MTILLGYINSGYAGLNSCKALSTKKKDAQAESCDFPFIWGKLRTAAWETAPLIVLRDCCKEVVGEGQYIRFLKGKFNAIKCLLYKRLSASHKELSS